MPPLRRRTLVKSLAALPLIGSLSGLASASASSGIFQHGVASGDPDANSLVIWSRITTELGSVKVRWEVAEDAGFQVGARGGDVIASEHRDHTVKVLVDGLTPGSVYYYRFYCEREYSAVGRTRTLPVGDIAHIGLAMVSCSNYPFGFFNAYDAIAKDDAIDFVLHLGDYIYEYGAESWGGEAGRKIGRIHQPANEIVTLDDYRQRHAQYKSDAGSLAMNAAHPQLLVWDDHESANNPWMNGAQNHQPASEGLWHDRRAASLRAYYEWMPVREPQSAARRRDYWRHYQFGSLATLTTLETRHTGRAQQIDYSAYVEQIDSLEAAQLFEREVLGAPDRPMLSSAMEVFLAESLRDSVALDVPWRLIGNPMPMAKTRVPDLAAHGISMPGSDPNDPKVSADLVWKGRFNLPFYPDTWDGYPWARERFYDLCRQHGASDLVVLTGDSHSFWANQLSDDEGRAMGVEIGTAGVTSPGDFVDQGFDLQTAAQIDMLFAKEIAEVRWTDNLHQGYVRLTLTPAAGQADFIAVSTVLEPVYRVSVVHRESLIKSDDGVGYAG